jgi:hypothetical protein
MGDQPVARLLPINRKTKTWSKGNQTPTPRVGFEPMTPAFEYAKGSSRLGLTQPLIQLLPRAHSPGVKRPGCKSDYSLLTITEVKKTWLYTSTPPYTFRMYCLISLTQAQLYLYLNTITLRRLTLKKSLNQLFVYYPTNTAGIVATASVVK